MLTCDVTDDQIRELFERHCECRPFDADRTRHSHDCDDDIVEDCRVALGGKPNGSGHRPTATAIIQTKAARQICAGRIIHAEACTLLREIAARADWDLGIDSEEMIAKYSQQARLIAAEAVEKYAIRAFCEGGMSWRGPLMFAARDIETGIARPRFNP